MPSGLLPSALAIATLAAVTAAPVAHAAWRPALTLTRPAAENVAATGNAEGAELFAWSVTSTRRVRLPNRTGFAGSVRAGLRQGNGALGAGRTVSATNELVAGPAVALDANGNATVVWSQAGRRTRIMGAYRALGGRFGRPFELGRTTAFLDARPAIAVSPGGAATVAWNAGHHVQVARRPTARCRSRRASGCFGEPQSLSRGAEPAVAMSRGATAFVVYSATARGNGAGGTQLRLAIAPRDGLFGPTRALAGSGQASQPSLALAADGSAVIAWRGSRPTGGEQDVHGPILVTARDALGRVVGPVVVSQRPGSRPQLRLNDRGEAILAWNGHNPTTLNPDGSEVVVAVRPANGAVGPPTRISPARAAAGNASLATDAEGNAILAYTAAVLDDDRPPGAIVALAHHRPPGGTFGAPQLLPAEFAGAFVFGAGARVTAVSAGVGGRTALSDYVR